MAEQPLIRNLAVISDRQTCAIIDTEGTISWYCPNRFDNEAVFSLLIDEKQGGFWTVEASEKVFTNRKFNNRSSVLDTVFSTKKSGFTIADWMPVNSNFKGICRKFSKVPSAVTNQIRLRPDYGMMQETPENQQNHSVRFLRSGLWLHASHPITIYGELVTFIIPENEEGWAVLTNRETVTLTDMDASFSTTLSGWEEFEQLLNYNGPYQEEVENSIRALQQFVYQPTGGIIAAATTSLPEVLGGERNYDYRYVWTRDAALITGALAQIETTGEIERKFLAFIAGAMKENGQDHVSPFYAVDKKLIKHSRKLHHISGYKQSTPVLLGNSAANQRQLDTEANILLASKVIYDKYQDKINWDAVEQIADFICLNWQHKDNGIWEESTTRHYTSSKVFAARGLEFMAAYQEDKAKAKRWQENAAQIRAFVKDNCMTKSGAYAVFADSEDVDISTALFIPWSYDEPDSPAVKATIKQLEEQYSKKNLYWRRLEEFESYKEGAFLAGTCWMAHYYAIAGNLIKSKAIINAVLNFKNDLGYFSEEADLNTGQMLGNFPQTFVHSSFICAVNGYKMALAGKDSRVY